MAEVIDEDGWHYNTDKPNHRWRVAQSLPQPQPIPGGRLTPDPAKDTRTEED